MLVSAVSNQKGGVGKTALATNLAAADAEAGERVLVVDLDPQGHSSLHAGMREVGRYGSAAFQFLQHQIPLPQLIKETPWGYDLLAGATDVASTESELIKRLGTLREGLGALGSRYTRVYIDCPPALSVITSTALVAATQVIVPLPLEEAALDGVGLLLRTMQNLRGFNADLKLGAIILNMVERPTLQSELVRRTVMEKMPEAVLPQSVRRTTRCKDALTARRPVLVLDPKHKVSADLRQVAKELRARAA